MFQNKVIFDLLKMCSVLPVFVVAPAMAVEYPYTVNEGETLTVNGTIEDVVDTENRALTNKGTTTISGATIKNNSTTHKDGGGAVANSGNGLMNISDTSFVGNSAKYFGAFFSGTKTTGLTISDSRFESNTALEGGAAGLLHGGTITSTIFAKNTSTNDAENSDGAGALFLGAVSRTELNDVTFTENESETRGGAIAMRSYDMGDNTDARLDIISSKFISNVAATNGGAIDNSFYSSKQNVTAVYIANTEFKTNTAADGGAIYNHGEKDLGGNTSSLMSVWSNYTGNTATNNGGAIYNMNGAGLTLKGGTFKGNSAEKQGGAIYNAGVVKATNVTFEDNSAYEGGALMMLAEGLTSEINHASFISNHADSYVGGAISLGYGKLNLNDVVFEDNTAGWGGAIFMYSGKNELNIDNGWFENNSALGSGAIAAMYNTNISNTTFVKNHASATEDEDGGGAMFVGAVGKVKLDNVQFLNNRSELNGGALSTRAAKDASNKDAKLDIVNSVFTGNVAVTTGGAIDSFLYGSAEDVTKVYVENTAFNQNKAKDGGAIYVHGEVDASGNKAALKIKDSTFIGNEASQNGGAIYNMAGGLVSLYGNNVFSGNKTGSELNDIYNEGELNISGNLTLDGGIAGDGTIDFTGDTNLITRLQKDSAVISGKTVSGLENVKIAGLVIENGLADAEYALVGAANAIGKQFGEITTTNALYDFSLKNVANGNILVTRKSVAEQTAGLEKAGLDSNAAKTIAAISGVKTTGNVAADALFADLTAAAQSGDTAAAKAINEVAKTINPESEAVVQSAAVSTQNIINDLAVERMDMGRNGGDLSLTSGGVWVQGLFNRAKSGDKFSANTRGISAGIDETINKDVMLGIGYAYGHSDVSAKTRDTDIDNHSVFLYGQYKPTQWYANATLNYTTSGYKENGSVAGLLAVNSEYRANAFGANVATGYELPFGLIPELGLRYLHVRTNDYTNSLGFHTDAKNTNFLTGIIGARYGFDIAASDAWLIRPELSAAAKYDLVSNGNTATVALPGVDAYTLDVERLKRFGGEFGVGLAMSYYGFDLSLSYYIDVREDYTSQTGMAKFRYNF